MTHETIGSSLPPDAFNQLIHTVTDAGLFLLAADGTIQSWNPGAGVLTGYSAPAVMGLCLSTIVRSQALQGPAQFDLRAVTNQGTWEGEIDLIRADGTTLRVAATLTALGGTGCPGGFTVYLRMPASCPAPAAQVLNEPDSNLLEHAVLGIFRSSPEGRYLMANPALARILGYGSRDELLTAVTDIANQVYAHPAQRSENLRRLAKQDSMVDFECEGLRQDGTRIWLRQDSRAVRDDSGKVLY